MQEAGKSSPEIVCHGQRNRRERGNWLLEESRRIRTNEGGRNTVHGYHRRSNAGAYPISPLNGSFLVLLNLP